MKKYLIVVAVGLAIGLLFLLQVAWGEYQEYKAFREDFAAWKTKAETVMDTHTAFINQIDSFLVTLHGRVQSLEDETDGGE